MKTYGCQMNVYDSERMADVLRPLGYGLTDTPEGADLVVLNTCHIREKAAEKVYSELGRLKEWKAAKAEAGGGRMTIAVAGCVAQAEGAELMRRAPTVDLVVGPQAYHQLPELIARVSRSRGERLAADFAPEAKFDALPQDRAVSGPAAFLTVQEGCDKFCAFCVVPYTRGAEYSRPAAAIKAEARDLAGRGVREITLLGQNVNAYAGPGGDNEAWTLARLIRALAQIPGLDRIRYTTSHPRDMGEDLIAAHGEVEALMPYLHLPVQSGSDKVLRAMNRAHAAETYLRLVERILAARPDIALSGDFIVGLPPARARPISRRPWPWCGEVRYAALFLVQIFLCRPGTPASAMPGTGRRSGQDRSPRPAAGPARRSAPRLQRRHRRAHPAGPVRARGTPSRPDRRPQPLSTRAFCLATGPASLIGQIAAGPHREPPARTVSKACWPPGPRARPLERPGRRGVRAPLGCGRARGRRAPQPPRRPDGGSLPGADRDPRRRGSPARRRQGPGRAPSGPGGHRRRRRSRRWRWTRSDIRAAVVAARAGEANKPWAPARPCRPRASRGRRAQDRRPGALPGGPGRANELVFGVGPAGTGKTFLAVAYGAATCC